MSDSAEAGDADDLTAGRDDDSRLVKLLRSQLKAATRELGEVRREAEQLREAGGGERVVEKVPEGLRQAYERQAARLRELEAAQRAQSLRAAFDEAGVPPGPLRDLLGEKINGDEVNVEGLQAWMAEAGIQRFDPVAAHRTAVTQRMDELRASAVPVGSQKMSHEDFAALRSQNPSAAAQVLTQGQVDLPPYVTSALDANRREREQNGGF